MGAFIARRLGGSALVLFLIFSLSFLIMRLSPGSPFDQDRQLPPAVVANQARVLGMAEGIAAERGGVIVSIEAEPGQKLDEGARYAIVAAKDGSKHALRVPRALTVFRVVRRRGETIARGKVLLYATTSLLSQYAHSLTSMLRLDFGVTFDSQGQRSVADNLRETLPVSMELGFYALCFALFLGVPAGIAAGRRQGSLTDYSVMSLALVGISIPTIISGPLLIMVFVVKLAWLPPQGGWQVGFFSAWSLKILPALTLGLVYAARFARLARAGMLEVASADWIRTARAKGLSERVVVMRHALRGAVLPVVSYLGPAAAQVLVGSVVVETVFNIPGVSKYFITSAINRDYPMVMGVVVVYSTLLVLFNVAVDVAYAALDPRQRTGGAA
ncbi:MAG: ABC transporter permease [Myxococcales bacterium]|nr:ABC transporter permease [Myxococcales bacterium]